MSLKQTPRPPRVEDRLLYPRKESWAGIWRAYRVKVAFYAKLIGIVNPGKNIAAKMFTIAVAPIITNALVIPCL